MYILTSVIHVCFTLYLCKQAWEEKVRVIYMYRMHNKVPYSGKFSLVQTFALSPVSAPEEIFVVLNFAPSLC